MRRARDSFTPSAPAVAPPRTVAAVVLGAAVVAVLAAVSTTVAGCTEGGGASPSTRPIATPAGPPRNIFDRTAR